MFFKTWQTWFSYTGERLIGDECRSRDVLPLSVGQVIYWRGPGGKELAGTIELVVHNFDSRCTTVSCRRWKDETNT